MSELIGVGIILLLVLFALFMGRYNFLKALRAYKELSPLRGDNFLILFCQCSSAEDCYDSVEFRFESFDVFTGIIIADRDANKVILLRKPEVQQLIEFLRRKEREIPDA